LGEAASLLRDRNSFKGPGNPHARNEHVAFGFSLERASLSSVKMCHFSFLGPAYRILEKQNRLKKFD
jgi:hypothetical protein